MILHLSQIFFTDGFTFIFTSYAKLLEAICNTTATQVIGRKLHGDSVTGQNTDKIHTHLTGNVSQNNVVVFQFYLKHGVR